MEMKKLLKQLKEELDMLGNNQNMITMKKTDLENLIREYEKMKEEQSNLLSYIRGYEEKGN